MSRVRGSIEIARRPEEVFDVIADQRNEVRFNPTMTEVLKLTDDPIGVGTTFRATVFSRSKPVEMTIVCTGFDRPRRFATRSVMSGAVTEGEVHCDPIPAGTLFSWDWRVSVSGPARIAGPLIRVIGRRRERRVWTGLKRMLEAGTGARADADPLMDQFLPRYDVDVVHAETFRASPAACYQGMLELDLFKTPMIRVALGIRAFPQRILAKLRARTNLTAPEKSRATFRVKDMVDLGWILLSETPGVETILGQVSRPWRAVADPVDPPATPEDFMDFGAPGFAKIVTSLRADPNGNDRATLTIRTRVLLTDEKSRRRFKRYWLLVGPVSSVIRDTALHQLATQLHHPPRAGATDTEAGA